MLRECDNDSCDYETYVDAEGRARARWDHVEGCEGFPPLDPEIVKNPRPGSFLAFMLGRE